MVPASIASAVFDGLFLANGLLELWLLLCGLVISQPQNWSANLVTYLRFAGGALPAAVGAYGPNGSWRSDGREGHLSYGPYVRLEPGEYVAGVRLRKLPQSGVGRVDFDVYSPDRGVICAARTYTSELFEKTTSLIHLEFLVKEPIVQVEARLFVQENVIIQQDELVVFNQNVRAWGG